MIRPSMTYTHGDKLEFVWQLAVNNRFVQCRCTTDKVAHTKELERELWPQAVAYVKQNCAAEYGPGELYLLGNDTLVYVPSTAVKL